MIKIFEEYKYFPFGGEEHDPDEPFFIYNKFAYFREINRRERELREEEYQREVERKRLREQEKQRAIENEYKPLINRVIDTLKNHPERIKKCLYIRKESVYGVLLNDGISIVAEANRKDECKELYINKTKIPFFKDKITIRNENDPFAEEDWQENQKSIAEELGDMVIDYVKNNEVIW